MLSRPQRPSVASPVPSAIPCSGMAMLTASLLYHPHTRSLCFQKVLEHCLIRHVRSGESSGLQPPATLSVATTRVLPRAAAGRRTPQGNSKQPPGVRPSPAVPLWITCCLQRFLMYFVVNWTDDLTMKEMFVPQRWPKTEGK